MADIFKPDMSEADYWRGLPTKNNALAMREPCDALKNFRINNPHMSLEVKVITNSHKIPGCGGIARCVMRDIVNTDGRAKIGGSNARTCTVCFHRIEVE